jgi:hypothetical protein
LTRACEFEQLRKKFGCDEIQAWTEYSEIKRGDETRVVSPFLYDVNPLVRAANDAAGSKREKQQRFLTNQVSKTNGASSMCRGRVVSLSFKASLTKSHISHLQGQGWKSKQVAASLTKSVQEQ